MTMFTCSTCGKKWPQNYCPECARTIDRSRTAPEPGTRGSPAASAPNPEGRNRAIHSRQTLYPTKQAAVQDPIIGNATPRKCSCGGTDRKSTRLNSSHLVISYAVFCLKKK